MPTTALARTLRPGKDYVRLTHQGEVLEGEVWAVDTCGRTTELQLMLADGMRVLTVDSETPCEVRPQSADPLWSPLHAVPVERYTQQTLAEPAGDDPWAKSYILQDE